LALGLAPNLEMPLKLAEEEGHLGVVQLLNNRSQSLAWDRDLWEGLEIGE
jgi:hypothetical protein